MFKFFSKKSETTPSELASILAEDRKKQNELINQNIEKLVVPLQEMLQKQQEFVDQKNAAFWNGYEQANANSLILLEKYKKQETLAQEEAERKKIEAQGIKAAYTLNMCMVSLSQIVDYNDINILHQEYDAILNNLNLENMIKDETLLDALKKILDTCHFYILHEKDKEMLKKKQAARLKGALGKALGGKSIIAVFGNANPWAMVAGAAVLIGSSIVGYKSEKNKAQMENEAEEWELEKTALEQLHNLRKVLFETAWRLAEKYKFPEKYRLTEKQIKVYDDAIADPDPLNRYERLELLQDQFEAYPLFWYYLGRAALETADLYRPLRKGELEYRRSLRPENTEVCQVYRDKAKNALEKFIEIHSENQLLREDVVAASAYLDASDFYLDDPEKMKKCIDNAKAIAGMDFEILQTCAFRYGQLIPMFIKKGAVSVAEDCRKEAIYCLRLLLNEGYNPDLNGHALSQLYIDGGKTDEKYRGEYEILKDCVAQKAPFVYFYIQPWDEESYKKDLRKFFLNDSLLNTIGKYFEGCIRYIFLEFYEAVYKAKSEHDNTALEDLKKIVEDKKYWEEDCRYILSGEFSKLDQFKTDCFNVEIGFHSCDEALKQYVDEIRKFIDESKTTERRFVTAGLWKHHLDFSQEDFEKRLQGLDNTLRKLVSLMAAEIYSRVKARGNEIAEEREQMKEDNSDPEDWKKWAFLPTTEDFILELVSFMTAESEQMRQTFQRFTGDRFNFGDYPLKE